MSAYSLHEETLDLHYHQVVSLSGLFEDDLCIDWLEELTGLKASLIIAILEQGVEQGLLERVRPAIYRLREKARNAGLLQLPQDQMERVHRRIALILIRELPDNDLKPLKVAHHLLHVADDYHECRWLMTAGEIFTRQFQAKKAIACFTHILRRMSQCNGENEDMLFIEAAVAYSISYTGRADLLLYKSFLAEARERARRLGRPGLILLLEMHIAKHERLCGEFNQAITRFERAFAQVELLGDPELTAATTTFHTFFLFWQGRFQEVISVYEKSLADVQKIPVGYFPILASVMVGHCYFMVGQVTQGLGMLDALRTDCLENKDLYLAAHASSIIAMVMLSINRLDDATRYLKLSYKEALQTGNIWVKGVATLKTALIQLLRGEGGKAARYLRKFLQEKNTEQSILLLYPYLMELGWAARTGTMPPIEGFSLEAEIDRFLRLKNIYMKGIAYRYKALLAMRSRAAHTTILHAFGLSAKYLRQTGNQIELSKTLFELARYHLSIGHEKKAKRLLGWVWDLLSTKDLTLIPEDLRPLIVKESHDGAILADLIATAELIASPSDHKKFLQQILTTANRITGAERGALLVVVDRSLQPFELRVRTSRNFTDEQLNNPGFSATLSQIREVIESGHGRILDMVSAQETPKGSAQAIRSGISVPLICRGETIGALYQDNRLIGNIFKEADLKLLSFLSAFAALDLYGEMTARELTLLTQAPPQRPMPKVHAGGVPSSADGMIGESPAFCQVLTQIDQVAGTDTAVLITGETGVGKNIIAAAIHRRSRRCAGPFVTVQCNALTEGLITSELFGHEKGAFTGAVNRHIGRFELADNGTLFLDEIGDLSLEVQSRLLRVLQSKEFERVGGGRHILISDFRLIAATNRNLEQEVLSGRFRRDLYYRINVFPVHVPPLRERREDIALLANYFLEQANIKQGMQCTRLSQQVLQNLTGYAWPGNIRELENVILRGVIASRGRQFKLPQLKPVSSLPEQPLEFATLAENERRHILEALQRCRGKIHGANGAAEILGINAYTLTSRMKKLGIAKTMAA